MTGNRSSVTTVNLSDVSTSLEAVDATNHAVVISTPQGTLKIVGQVDQLRSRAQRDATGLPIPALPTPAPSAVTSTPSEDEGRLARLEDAVARLTGIAERAQRRGLI